VSINLPAKFNPKDFNKKRKPNEIEKILTQYKVKVNEIIGEMMEQNLPITAETLRDYLKTGGTKSKYIRELTSEFIKYIETKVNKTITFQVYKKYLLVKEFVDEMIGDKQLCTVTNGDIIRLYDILKEKYLPSTSAGYMTKIKSMFYYAIDNGLMKTNPVNCIKINKGAVNVNFLSEDDIDKIKNLNLSMFDRLEKVKDLLLFQSSTGVAYCDLVAFNSENVIQVNGVNTYTGKRQKTGVEFTSVILPMGMEILEKYSGKLPLISNQKYNKYLKEIQELANIKTNITTHLLRKTYCHILLNSGVRAEVVAKCMGHTKITTTLKHYARITTNTVVNEVGKIIRGV
jgi:site-specific recombinase XerD